MKKNNQSFNQILSKVAESNMQMLMSRARIANRIAKSASAKRAKSRAYDVKSNTLKGLKRFFPEEVKVEYDFRRGSGIVSVNIAKQNFALHSPAENFALDA